MHYYTTPKLTALHKSYPVNTSAQLSFFLPPPPPPLSPPLSTDVTYLDHAGATLYAKSQLEAHFASLTTNLYGNPHSQNPCSQQTAAAVDHARESILRFFGTDPSRYDVVFTSGCTGALRLLAESFPWQSGQNPASENGPSQPQHALPGSLGLQAPETNVLYTGDLRETEAANSSNSSAVCASSHPRGSVFCYLEDNHTSVVGMREVATQFGASVVCTTERDIIQSSQSEYGMPRLQSGATQLDGSHLNSHHHQRSGIHHLFAYPAQSNFSGRKYPLSWTVDIPSGKLLVSGLGPPSSPSHLPGSWKICLDAASFAGTNPLDLSKYPADFVTVAFYKMFGYPTSLGALLVRKDNSCLLRKRYFGGGTVASTVSRAGLHSPRSVLHER